MQSSIIIRNLLPTAFSAEHDNHATSAIWLTDELRFDAGRRYLVSAESGRGKSSLCAFLYGTRTDYEGSVSIDGTDPRKAKASALASLRRHIVAYLPQDIKLFPSLTVMENILLKNDLTSHKSHSEIMEMLETVEMDGFASRKAAKLSWGQQQRAAMVRTLCQPFRFLILDEPASHLDARANAAMAALVSREAGANGAGVIVTSVGYDLALDGYISLAL